MHSHNETLRVLHTIYRNTLEPFTMNDIPAITTRLYPHQKSLIHGMHTYRARMTQGVQLDDHELKSKIGILGDPSRSGKTLAVLGYMATDTQQYPTTELTPYSSPFFYSQKVSYPQNATNLIIVPSHLFGHWQDEIKKHTTLPYVAIDTRGKLKNDMVQTILSSTFILTTNKCLRHIQEYASRNHITWNNIFIDEPLFIQLKASEPRLQFQFLWLISYQWQSLLFRTALKKSQLLFLQEPMHADLEEMLLDNITEECHIYPSQYMKQYVEYNHSHRGYILLRNATKHIRDSLPAPILQHSIIQCKSTTTLQSLSSMYLSRNTAVSSTNIPGLFQALGIESSTPEEYLVQHEGKRELIQRKINENECGICLDACVYPTIVHCCYHLYCGKCLLQNTIIQYKCPTCRITLDVTRMHCLAEIGTNDVRTKRDATLDVIRTKQPCIIFIALDKIYHDLLPSMKSIGIQSELITSFSLRKAIKNITDGTSTVLFVSKVELIRGLSVPSSCLLFYHEQPVFEQRQALINMASQSSSPLQILHLHSEVQM